MKVHHTDVSGAMKLAKTPSKLIREQKNEFHWRPNGTYSSDITKGLNKIRFKRAEKGITCQFFGLKRSVPFDIELAQLLNAEATSGKYVEIWEDVYFSLHEAQCKPDYLSIVAAAGVTLALKHERWPLFSNSRPIISEFRKLLPKDAQIVYLLYCKKVWRQHSLPDFVTWCDAEIDFIKNTQ